MKSVVIAAACIAMLVSATGWLLLTKHQKVQAELERQRQAHKLEEIQAKRTSVEEFIKETFPEEPAEPVELSAQDTLKHAFARWHGSVSLNGRTATVTVAPAGDGLRLARKDVGEIGVNCWACRDVLNLERLTLTDRKGELVAWATKTKSWVAE